MRFEEKLKRYADLAVRAGCNLQKGQDLYLTAPICAAEFARMTVKSAYEAGARQVIVQWTDEAVTRMGYEYSPLEVYEQYPEWMAKLRNGAAEQGAAMLFIDASNPGAMAGIDPRKPAASSRASNAACKPYRDAVNQGHHRRGSSGLGREGVPGAPGGRGLGTALGLHLSGCPGRPGRSQRGLGNPSSQL